MTTIEFNETVNMYSDNLYRFVLKNIRDEDVARDIVQDTFEKMWRHVDEIDFKTVKSYMFSVGYRTMIDHIRKNKRITDFEEVNPAEHSTDKQYLGLSEILAEALKILPEIQRTVVMLRDYEGYPYDEIGEITGLNESQVKVYIFRARKALKNYIGKLETVL
ncbi:MAG: RNA polymerase sigma factor [Bacteroidetes bacterium]|nr:RNA polymerase sigma factor [Bacteroidota bacterium]